MAHIKTQTEWENDMSVKILQHARSEIYLDLRYLDVALSALKPQAMEGLETMATDGESLFFSAGQVIRVFRNNPAFMNRAYLHTVLHCIFSHLFLKGNRDTKLWNLACDIVVEQTIDGMDKPCTRRALSFLRQQTYEGLKGEGRISAAVVYRWLRGKSMEELLALNHEFYTDDHRFWKEETGNGAASAARNKWNKIARQTSMTKKRHGDEPEKGEELLMTQISAAKSRRSYKEFLQKFSILQEELKCNPDEYDLNYYTYGLRLYKNMPLIEPVESREVKKIREFVVVVDTSYSTSGSLIKGFLNETFGILSQQNSFFRRCRIRIIQCDDKVEMDEVISSQEEMERLLKSFQVVGGGNTDFRPAFTYVNQLIKEGSIRHLDGLLYFTDGKGIYPVKKPEYKTAFLFLGAYDETVVPPWAMRLQLEPEELEQNA